LVRLRERWECPRFFLTPALEAARADVGRKRGGARDAGCDGYADDPTPGDTMITYEHAVLCIVL